MADTTQALSLDWMVSVDDHVLEPASVWQDRVPARYREKAPRLAQTPDGEFWLYEDRRVPTGGLAASAGMRKEDFTPNAISYLPLK